jgi:Domain of unknown function (DUF4249)
MSSTIKKLLVSIIFALWGCAKEVSLPYPEGSSQIVLNGILQPDSTIKISLSRTLSVVATDSAYPFVSDAKVNCFENGKWIGTLTHLAKGVYSLPVYPKQNAVYGIEVIHESTTLTAQDTMPPLRTFKIEIGKPNPANYNENPDMRLFCYRNKPNYTWLAALYKYRWSNNTKTNSAVVASNSPFLDTFNSYRSLNGSRTFGTNVRIKPEFIGDITIDFTVTNQAFSAVKDKGDVFYIEIAEVSHQYDKYLKSAILAYENRPVDFDGRLNNPFAEPVAVYSNIKNGLGIFGAMQLQRIVIKKVE